jgi:hypothetical protein
VFTGRGQYVHDDSPPEGAVDTFVSDIVDGVPNGKCSVTRSDGELSYEGDIVNDERTGECTHLLIDEDCGYDEYNGFIFAGVVKNGLPDGLGTMTNPNTGEKKEGVYTWADSSDEEESSESSGEESAEESAAGGQSSSQSAEDEESGQSDEESMDEAPEQSAAAAAAATGHRRRRKKGGASKLSEEQINMKTDEVMAQIKDKTLLEGCVMNGANQMMVNSDQPVFTMDEQKASLRKVIELAIKKGQPFKTIFGTNKLGDLMDDEAVVSQVKYMLEERYGHGNYTFENVHPTLLTTSGDDGVEFLVQGVMERVKPCDKPTWAHYDKMLRQDYTQLVHVLDGTPGYTNDEVPRNKDGNWQHTIVIKGNKKRFYCHNLMGQWPDGVDIAHLGLGKDGQPKDDGTYYMRSIKRVYKVAPFATEEVKRKLEERKWQRLKKRQRAQHADFNGAEVMAYAVTHGAAVLGRTEHRQPSWADSNDRVYGDKGKKTHENEMKKLKKGK